DGDERQRGPEPPLQLALREPVDQRRREGPSQRAGHGFVVRESPGSVKAQTIVAQTARIGLVKFAILWIVGLGAVLALSPEHRGGASKMCGVDVGLLPVGGAF